MEKKMQVSYEHWETILCAQMNLDNLAKMVPGIANNPMYLIVKDQLDRGIKAIEDANEVRNGEGECQK